MKNDIKQELIDYLRACDSYEYLDDIQIYDELQALLEKLHDCYIIDSESYEQAENTLCKLWGFENE